MGTRKPKRVIKNKNKSITPKQADELAREFSQRLGEAGVPFALCVAHPEDDMLILSVAGPVAAMPLLAQEVEMACKNQAAEALADSPHLISRLAESIEALDKIYATQRVKLGERLGKLLDKWGPGSPGGAGEEMAAEEAEQMGERITRALQSVFPDAKIFGLQAHNTGSKSAQLESAMRAASGGKKEDKVN